MQYGGSEAFHKAGIIKSKEGWKPIKENITFKAIKRYMNNVFTDSDKQKSIMLFVGDYVPLEHHADNPIWDEIDFTKWEYRYCAVVTLSATRLRK